MWTGAESLRNRNGTTRPSQRSSVRSNWIQRNLTHTIVWDAFTSLSGKLLTLRKCLAWFAKSTTNPRKTWCAKCPRFHQRYRKRKQGEDENSVEVGNSVAVEVGYLPSRRSFKGLKSRYCPLRGCGSNRIPQAA